MLKMSKQAVVNQAVANLAVANQNIPNLIRNTSFINFFVLLVNVVECTKLKRADEHKQFSRS